MSNPVLYAACVLIWGTTWFAITAQLEVLAPEVGVAIRFLMAGLALAAGCRAARIPLRFPRRVHGLMLVQGLAGFCASYIGVYHAERFVASGVVAVGYAAQPLFFVVLARVFLGTPMSGRVAVGGVVGIVGVVLIFGHEFARMTASRQVAWGAELTAASVALSSVATIAAVRYHRLGVGGWAPLAWAMGYGGAGAALVALVAGRPWGWAWTLSFLGSLAWLAIAGSIAAFGGYFALVRRIGPAKASYVGVVTPVVALAVSSLLEDFAWTRLTIAGVALAITGNVIALWPGTPAPSPQGQPD